MSAPPRRDSNGDSNGYSTGSGGNGYDQNTYGGSRRDRLMYEVQNAEDTARVSLLHGGEVVTQRAKTLWTHFRDFIDNGNVVGLAVGLIIGASFTALVNSLVDDIISPPLGVALGQASLDDLFVVIQDGKNASAVYLTLKQAHDDGAVCIAYGRFVQMTVNFFIVSFVLFLLVKGQFPSPPHRPYATLFSSA
ncbi:large conductance mechanosensitive channel [Entomortierella parvispora]|uniref:Large conductance mechanosensitive channel n=1 Tax=Entomortierella parvispora TaxID=205924 RepID=A0A9P3GZT4_9FUNG|nr:large conductance mechanosensitive channel [Entomortierella parvispora]